MRVTLEEGEFTATTALQLGQQYVVYALYLNPSQDVMVLTESMPATPYSVPLEQVKIVDGRVSRYWVVGSASPRIISFPEWANDSYFYQNVVEGKNAASIWRKYKYLMDKEFYDPSLTLTATKLDGGWLQCANCFNAWLAKTGDEVVECPSCSTVQNSVSNKE